MARFKGICWLKVFDPLSLNPSAKMASFLIVVAAALVSREWVSMLLLFCLVLAAVFVCGVQWTELWKSLRVPALFLAVILFIQLIFVEAPSDFGGHVGGRIELFKLGHFVTTLSDAVFVAFLGLRVLSLMLVAFLAVRLVRPSDVIEGFDFIASPLAFLRLPVKEFLMALTIAVLFAPVVTQETVRILKAQRARGFALFSGGLLRKAIGLRSVIVPVFLSSYRRSLALAEAMEARCYVPGVKRTRYFSHRVSAADIVVLGGSSLLLALSMLGRSIGLLLMKSL